MAWNTGGYNRSKPYSTQSRNSSGATQTYSKSQSYKEQMKGK